MMHGREPSGSEGWVPTPGWLVGHVLDEMGYAPGAGAYGKMLLEPSCGTGHFLLAAVDRFVKDGLAQGEMPGAIVRALDACVHGIETDALRLQACRRALDTLVGGLLLGAPVPNWPGLRHADALALDWGSLPRFDWVMGNPPFMRDRMLDAATRERLRRIGLTGNQDASLAFMRLSRDVLAQGGCMGLVTPLGWLRNTAARGWREALVRDADSLRICDWGSRHLFKGVHVYICTLVLRRDGRGELLLAQPSEPAPPQGPRRKLDVRGLPAGPWVWETPAPARAPAVQTARPRFGDLFEVRNGLATLCDRVFISSFSAAQPDSAAPCGGLVRFNGVPVEASLLRPVAKAAGMPAAGRLGAAQATGWLLLPYRVVADRLRPLPQSLLESKYPQAWAWLLSHEAVLSSRSLPPGAPWWAFGRNQGLKGVNAPRVLVHPYLRDEPRFGLVPAGMYCYSGFQVAARPSGPALEEALRWLGSQDFVRWVHAYGAPLAGGWRRLSSRMLQDWRVPP